MMQCVGIEQLAESATSAEVLAASRAVLGNDPQLEAAYQAHFAFVWRSLRRLGTPPELLDDAAQDVFMVALRRAAEFRRQSSYRTWLFGIASNVVREQRRKWQRATRLEPIDDELSLPAPSPLEHAENAQALRFVDGFLGTLDDAKREVFILVELEQMPVPEVAQALGIKLNTAYSRLRIARETFFTTVQQTYGNER